MILVIYGSRGFKDRELIYAECDRCRDVTAVLDGGARGVDRIGGDWARSRGIPVLDRPAEWERYGKSRAGKIRNDEMADECHMGLGFWDGQSSGTADMSKRLKKYNKPYRVVQVTIDPFEDFMVKDSADGTLEDLI